MAGQTSLIALHKALSTSVSGNKHQAACLQIDICMLIVAVRMNNGSLMLAQDIAKNARKLEFVGLGLSFVSLLCAILIFSCFRWDHDFKHQSTFNDCFYRRLRVFRNLLHLQLMVAIGMMVVIRLVLYIDLVFTEKLGHVAINNEGRTINTMPYVCESAYIALEYFKTVAFW